MVIYFVGYSFENRAQMFIKEGFWLFQFLKWKHFHLKCSLGYGITAVK